MTPISQIELNAHFKDLERQLAAARRSQGAALGWPMRFGPRVVCAKLRGAFGVLLRATRGAGHLAVDQKP